MSNFEKASRAKIRFTTDKGLLTVEDLWDVPLLPRVKSGTCLDNIAKNLHRTLKERDTESFVVKTTKPCEITQLKFDIVKHIIDVRLAEDAAARVEKDRKEKKQRIMAIIADKEDAVLADMDLDALRKLMDEY